MIEIDFHFTSELLAFGRVRRGPEDAGWRQGCVTGSAQALSFPRRSFSVTPGYRSASPVTLHPGLVSLTRTEVEYSRALIDRRGEESEWLWIRPDLLDELLTEWIHGTHQNAWLRPVSPPLLLRQRALCAATEGQARSVRAVADGAEVEPPHLPVNEDQALLEAHALEFVADLSREGCTPNATESRQNTRRRAAISGVVESLALEPGKSRTTAELAAIAGLSPSHFCVAFRRETGRTLSDYLATLRLCVAVDRLCQRGGDLTQLALALGFSSHAHFSARFKKLFGCTPSQARRMLNTGTTHNTPQGSSSIARKRPWAKGPSGPGRISAT